jgi:hypothetical protein
VTSRYLLIVNFSHPRLTTQAEFVINHTQLDTPADEGHFFFQNFEIRPGILPAFSSMGTVVLFFGVGCGGQSERDVM